MKANELYAKVVECKGEEHEMYYPEEEGDIRILICRKEHWDKYEEPDVEFTVGGDEELKETFKKAGINHFELAEGIYETTLDADNLSKEQLEERIKSTGIKINNEMK